MSLGKYMTSLRAIRRAEGVPEHMLDLLPSAFERNGDEEAARLLELGLDPDSFSVEHYFPQVQPCR